MYMAVVAGDFAISRCHFFSRRKGQALAVVDADDLGVKGAE